MNLVKTFWRYWMWVCTALVTTAAALYVLSTVVTYFKAAPAHQDQIGQCIDEGGTWDAEEGQCKRPA